MKTLFALAVIATVSVPALAFAAYNDVTLTTGAVILVGGYSLDMSGSSATIQSITVNASSFSVTLASGSSFTVSSPTLQQLSSDVTSDVTSNTCTGSASSISLAYSGAGTVTNVITPSATVCSGSGGASPPVSSGQGGGGLIVGSGPLAPGYVNTKPTATSSAVAAIVSTTTSARDHSSVATTTASGTQTRSSGGITLTKNYRLWDRSGDIRSLQKFFNTHGFVVAQSGPGSPGNETSIFGINTYRALIKFQKVKGFRKLATSGP